VLAYASRVALSQGIRAGRSSRIRLAACWLVLNALGARGGECYPLLVEPAVAPVRGRIIVLEGDWSHSELDPEKLRHSFHK
jgi:hypothetical protein